MDQVCDELDLAGLTPHDLRRTFGSLASLARLAGADLKYIQEAMGHSAITVTVEIYAHLFDSELDQVSDALWRWACRCGAARSDPGCGWQIVSTQRGDSRVHAGSRTVAPRSRA